MALPRLLVPLTSYVLRIRKHQTMERLRQDIKTLFLRLLPLKRNIPITAMGNYSLPFPSFYQKVYQMQATLHQVPCSKSFTPLQKPIFKQREFKIKFWTCYIFITHFIPLQIPNTRVLLSPQTTPTNYSIQATRILEPLPYQRILLGMHHQAPCIVITWKPVPVQDASWSIIVRLVETCPTLFVLPLLIKACFLIWD